MSHYDIVVAQNRCWPRIQQNNLYPGIGSDLLKYNEPNVFNAFIQHLQIPMVLLVLLFLVVLGVPLTHRRYSEISAGPRMHK